MKNILEKESIIRSLRDAFDAATGLFEGEIKPRAFPLDMTDDIYETTTKTLSDIFASGDVDKMLDALSNADAEHIQDARSGPLPSEMLVLLTQNAKDEKANLIGRKIAGELIITWLGRLLDPDIAVVSSSAPLPYYLN